MIAVGSDLRNAYFHQLFADVDEISGKHFKCRSTNLCRTVMSLRALLAGLMNVSDSQTLPIDFMHPVIHTRIKSKETMYPDCNDVPCLAAMERRKALYKDNYIAKHFEGYDELESTFKSVLGYTDRVSWLTARECVRTFTAYSNPADAARGYTEVGLIMLLVLLHFTVLNVGHRNSLG